MLWRGPAVFRITRVGTATNVNRTLIVNRGKPPFDNPDLRFL